MTREESTQSHDPAEPRGHVVTLFLGDTVRSVPLPSDGEVTFGRDEACELSIDEPSISRRHARVTASGSRFHIEDLRSRNGTRVRGTLLSPGARVALHVGDVVECGAAVLLVRRAAAVAQTTPLSLIVGGEARWFEPASGTRIQLGRRGALRLLLAHLTRRRIEEPGRSTTVEEMFAVGWPGERALAESASARVYTSVQRLRSLGLGAALLTRDDGYLLDPSLEVRWA